MYSGHSKGAGLLGQDTYCLGSFAVGGAFTVASDFSAVTVTPDDAPGTTVVFTSPPGYIDTVRQFAASQGMSGRAALVGDFLSDGRVLFYGASGKLSANEFYAKQDRGGCNPYTTDPSHLGIPQGVTEAPTPTSTTPGITCVGHYKVGGRGVADGADLVLTPDDDPTHPIRAYGAAYFASLPYPQQPYVIIEGDLYSDNTMDPPVSGAYGGGGLVASNRPYQRVRVGDCTTAQTVVVPATAPTSATPPPAWTGAQAATVHVSGAGVPENVTLYGADGFQYKLASATNPTAATELATTAPQGTALTVTATWDAAAGLAAVTDWYITTLGQGSKTYELAPTGEVVQPGTAPSDGGAGQQPAPGPAVTTAGLARPLSRGELFGALGLLIALVGLNRRR